MGYYINPSDRSKEQWLTENGQMLLTVPHQYRDGNSVVVCLVDNGLFTAAGICINQNELQAFADPDGRRRPRVWWHVPISAIEQLHPDFKGVVE